MFGFISLAKSSYRDNIILKIILNIFFTEFFLVEDGNIAFQV